MSIGERVRKARKAKGLTQDELAAKVGIGQGTLSELERGDSAGTKYIATLASSLDVSPLWLETGRGPQKLALITQNTSDFTLDKIVKIVNLFAQSTPDGQDQILDAAIRAEKMVVGSGVPVARHEL